MKISVQKLVDRGFISQEQADEIVASERAKRTALALKLTYWIAGLFIGTGFLLIVGANIDDIPDCVKLLGVFAAFGGVLYGAFQSVLNKKDRWKEFFLTLSFLFVAGTIGLIGQIFNLSGGWISFAAAWAALGFVFVLFSKMIVLNLAWFYLLFACLFSSRRFIRFIERHFGDFIEQCERFVREYPTLGLILGTLFLALLTYAGNRLYAFVKKKARSPDYVTLRDMLSYVSVEKAIAFSKGFAVLSLFAMYYTALIGGGALGFKNASANVFVFVFLAVRLVLAMRNKDIQSFIRNTHLAECYILFVFVTRYHNLFESGVGFILGGVLLLGVLRLIRKTSKYIKGLEVFHE